MKKTMKRASALASMAMLAGSQAAMAEEVQLSVNVQEAVGEGSVQEAAAYDKVAQVTGTLTFNQDEVSPNDDIFNVFGTAVTAMCAKPGFVFEDGEVAGSNYFLNVGGQLEKSYVVNIADMMGKSTKGLMTCSCAMSSAMATAEVTGIPLAAIVEMVNPPQEINTVTVRGEDGYSVKIPLQFVLENEALLVYSVNGEALPASQGAPLQLWMPKAAARYFTRKVTDIELTAEAEAPEIAPPEDAYRAKINIVNHAEHMTFAAGQAITFEGYADDCGVAITELEFSLDGGENWTVYPLEGASADRWVCWKLSIVPEKAGTYQLTARAKTEDGTVSPLASSVVFTVE